MKIFAAALAALMMGSAPLGSASAFTGENADVSLNFERPAICEKAEGSASTLRFDGERVAEWRDMTEEERAEKLEARPMSGENDQ